MRGAGPASAHLAGRRAPLRGQFGAGGVKEDEGFLVVQADEDAVATPADFAQQAATVGDHEDAAQRPEFAALRAAPGPPEPPHTLPLDAAEEARLAQILLDDRYVEAVRHALRVVHAMATEPVAPDEAAQIEGHPDNVSACVLGSIVASAIDAHGETRAVRIDLPAKMNLAIVVPDFPLPTWKARAVLPETVSRVSFTAQREMYVPMSKESSTGANALRSV